MSDDAPFVSAIMATIPGRENLLDMALRCWRRQSYPADRRELILLSETAPPADLAPGESVFRFLPGTRLGVKLNRGTHAALGNFVVKLDDDDWYSTTYLERSISLVLSTKNPDRVILSPGRFPVYFVESGAMVRWESMWSGMGTGFLFSKFLWKVQKWDESIERGLDNRFVTRAQFIPVTAPDDSLCYIRHGSGHLFRKVGDEPADTYLQRTFKPFAKSLEELMGEEDAAFYRKMTSEARGDTLRG